MAGTPEAAAILEDKVNLANKRELSMQKRPTAWVVVAMLAMVIAVTEQPSVNTNVRDLAAHQPNQHQPDTCGGQIANGSAGLSPPSARTKNRSCPCPPDLEIRLAFRGVAMRSKEIHELGEAVYRRTLRPMQRPPRVIEGAVLVGWDSEFDGAGSISVQFAAVVDGALRSVVIETPSRFDSIEQFIGVLKPLLEEHDLATPDKRRRVRVFLAAHFAQAELSGFADPLNAWNIRQIGKAHHARAKATVDGVEWRLQVIDLFAFFPCALSKIGSFVGREKLTLDPTRIRHFFENERERFDAYAARDAEIAVLALMKFRDEVVQAWGVDPLVYQTASAIGSAIFRSKFLSKPATPIRKEREKYPRKTSTGWTTASRRVTLFDGEIGARLAAMHAGWGGRVEAYVRGLVVGPFVELDVVSLYPHSAILQPLPNCRTTWSKVTRVEQIEDLEGFATADFAFPKEFRYPCLPVSGSGETKLYFPRQGTTSATLAEIRIAVQLGAVISNIRNGWGFRPGAAEREHELATFMREVIKRKSLAPRKSVAYESNKLIANSFVGKLWERAGRFDLLETRSRLAQDGLSLDAFPMIFNSAKLRPAFKRRSDVGSAWCPEWAALILGRARALMAEIVAWSKPLLVSTDSIVALVGAADGCPAIAVLRSVGSDLLLERTCDAAFVARSREYALLRFAANVPADEQVLARNDTWAVDRIARHGSGERPDQFARTILACLGAGRDVAEKITKTSLVSAERAAKEGLRLNQEESRTMKTGFGWDGKRRLVDRDVNPFTSVTATAPYQTLLRAQRADQVSKSGGTRASRGRARLNLDRILSLLEAGKSVREISRLTGIPKSTIGDLKQRHTIQKRVRL
jgi:hypothetical protein